MNLQTESARGGLWLKTSILAAALAVFMVVFAAPAMAAPLAPELSVKPANPNLTDGVSKFTVVPAAGETMDINSFECSLDNANFTFCGFPPVNRSYQLANGEHTFRARAKSGPEIGPAVSYTWTQNVPPPTLEPVISTTPADPNSSTAATFTFALDGAETEGVTNFLCRSYATATPPATPETGWVYCGAVDAGTYTSSSLANGPSTFEVRSMNGNISGPAASYEWVQAVPAPSAAPDLTAKPANPNLTGTVSFTYAKGAGETNAVTNFQCRQYKTSTPPAGPEAGWSACGNGETGTKAYPNLVNDSYTFDVRARNGGVAGPVTTYVWAQAIPTPVAAPNITDKPESVHTTSTTLAFEFEPGEGETAPVDRYQCRVIPDGGSANWAACNNGTFKSSPGNGNYTFEVRAGNQASWSDEISSYELELDFANPAGSVAAGDVASTTWVGASNYTRLGDNQLLSPSGFFAAGDVNGDGQDDLLAQNASKDQTNVLFSNPARTGVRSIDDLRPADGYRIGGPTNVVAPIGDQNDDGLADLLTVTGATVRVVYGIDDPTTLPKCAGLVVRCLDLEDLDADQGYTIATGISFIQLLGSAGDFDGDGIEDIVVGDAEENNMVIKGAVRSGTLDVSTLGPDEKFTFAPSSGDNFINFSGVSVGDLNGDGKSEIAGMGNPIGGPGGMKVILGRTFSADNPNPLDTDTMTDADGFTVATAPFSLPLLKNIGDVNGDERPDLMIGALSLAPLLGGGAMEGESSIVYMPEFPVSFVLGGADLEPDQGYWVTGAGTESGLGLAGGGISDLNGDGIPDTLLGAMATPYNGVPANGAIYAMFTHATPGGDPVALGGAMTPDQGLAITEDQQESGFGLGVHSLGDLDGDGLSDFAASAPGLTVDGVNQAGAVHIIYGKSIMALSRTGKTSNVTDKSATLNGLASTNKRDSEVKFEIGTTDEYGSETAVQNLDGSRSADSVDAEAAGLEAKTEYHYRMVVTNDLGLTRYGPDKTFTTAATPPKEGCAADNTKPGCDGYDYCKANPDKDGCKDHPKSPAKLSQLFLNANKTTVKRGKKATVKVSIVNSGGSAASNVKLCVKAPKKLVKVKKCVTVGNLEAGSTANRKFKVTVKKKAKKGKKATLKFTATADGLGAKTGKVKLKVK